MKIRQGEIRADVIRYIADRVNTNIRELEGALVRLLAVASLEKTSISLESAQHILRDFGLGKNEMEGKIHARINEMLSEIEEGFSCTVLT